MSSIEQNILNRVKKLRKDIDKTNVEYESDNIYGVEKGIRNVGSLIGTGVGIAGDIASVALDPFVPDYIEEKIGEGIDYVAQTEPVQQAVGYISELAEENPRTAANLEGLLNIGSGLGVGKLGQMAGSKALSASQRIVENAPNELPMYYKGGAPAAALEMITASPGTLVRGVSEAVNPYARARARQGINTRLQNTIKRNNIISELAAKKASGESLTKGEEIRIKQLETRHQADLEKLGKTRESYNEGQLAQTALFSIQKTGKVPEALKKIYTDFAFVDYGDLNKKTFLRSLSKSPKKEKISWVDSKLRTDIYDALKNTFKIKDEKDFKFVLKNNNAFMDLQNEAKLRTASATGKRIFAAKDKLNKFFPNKNKFDSLDDLKEFIALRFLPDKLNEESNDKIYKYLQYKKILQDGKKLHPLQKKTYDKLKPIIDESKNNLLKVDEKNKRIFVSSTHVSQDKAAGGVADLFVFDIDGNVLHTMFDKNDIAAIPKTSIDIEFPGAGSPKKTGVKKMITMSDPHTYNLFDKRKEKQRYGTNPETVSQKERIEKEFGIPFESTGSGRGKRDLMTQASKAASDFTVRPEKQDVLGALENVAAYPAAAGLLTGLQTEQE